MLTDAGGGKWSWVAALLTVTYVLLLIRYAWIGFSESDDVFYATAAQQWVGHFHLAANHWGLRHAIVLPMALGFAVFGRNEMTLVFPSLLYFVLLLGLSYVCVRRIAGYYGGLLAVALVASTPVIVSGASWVTTDLPETFFLLASVWLFLYALETGGRVWQFVLCGIFAGLGLITRETSVVLAVFYGILMMRNYGGRRDIYLWIGVGVALVLAIDTAYLAGSGGDLLYRLHISQQGVKGDNPDMVAQFQTQQGLDRFGSLAAPRWLQAWIVLFFNQNFGILPWLGLAATVYLSVKAVSRIRTISRMVLLLAAVWFLVMSFVFTFLWLVPRYQILTAAALAMPLAIYLADTIRKGRVVVAVGVVSAAAGFALLAIGVSDRNPLFGEKALAHLAAQGTASRINTDPGTLRGAAWLLDANESAQRVVAEPPRPGDLYFFYDRPRRGLAKDWPVQRPGADWIEVAQMQEPPRPMIALIFGMGLDHVLPEAVVRKLNFQPRHAALFRLPASPSSASVQDSTSR
jgi:4-amino-4-deoxy-L-arabinose transferase-like glycosyltransferase